MTKTLQEALAPLLNIGSFYSLSWFEYPRGHHRPYLSYLYRLVTLSVYIYFNFPRIYRNWDNIVTDWLEIIKDCSTITSTLVSLFRFKELKMCLHELSIVDDTLEALGAPKEYQQLRNWIIRIIIGWIVYIFYRFSITFYLTFPWDFVVSLGFGWNSIYIFMMFIIFNFETLYINNINILSILIWGTTVGYVSSRFQRVNDLLHVLYTNFGKNNADYRRRNRFILVRLRITGIKDYKQYLWILMQVHLQLCLISRKLNKILNIQILMYIMWNCVETMELYVLMYWYLTNIVTLWTFQRNIATLYRIFNFIFYQIIFLTLNYIYQTVYYKINETTAISYKLSNYNLDDDLRKQILQFMLQIKQREVKFGIGLFHFGYNFICQFYSTTLSFLMILIQMDLATDNF